MSALSSQSKHLQERNSQLKGALDLIDAASAGNDAEKEPRLSQAALILRDTLSESHSDDDDNHPFTIDDRDEVECKKVINLIEAHQTQFGGHEKASEVVTRIKHLFIYIPVQFLEPNSRVATLARYIRALMEHGNFEKIPERLVLASKTPHEIPEFSQPYMTTRSQHRKLLVDGFSSWRWLQKHPTELESVKESLRALLPCSHSEHARSMERAKQKAKESQPGRVEALRKTAEAQKVEALEDRIKDLEAQKEWLTSLHGQPAASSADTSSASAHPVHAHSGEVVSDPSHNATPEAPNSRQARRAAERQEKKAAAAAIKRRG